MKLTYLTLSLPLAFVSAAPNIIQDLCSLLKSDAAATPFCSSVLGIQNVLSYAPKMRGRHVKSL